MPSWARWSLIGCGGCGALAVLGIGGCMAVIYSTVGKHMKWETIDVKNKPDMPLTATAGQLLPPKVGSFVRKSVGQPSAEYAGTTGSSGWQGTYVSGNQRVDLVVAPTTSVQQARNRRSPFGDAMQQQRRSQNPDLGFHMSMKIGPKPMDMVFWSKPNWTFMVQSPHMAAMPFAKAYRPARK
jgi:hypothetical protein